MPEMSRVLAIAREILDPLPAYSRSSCGMLAERVVYLGLARYGWLVRVMEELLPWANRVAPKLVEALFRRTVYPVFCGGATVEEALNRLRGTLPSSVELMVDYAHEHAVDGRMAEANCTRIRRLVARVPADSPIRHYALKISGIIPTSVLVHQSAYLRGRRARPHPQWRRYVDLATALAEFIVARNLTLHVDAEESWVQDAIHHLAMEWIFRWNRDGARVYTTFQMYRRDHLGWLEQAISDCRTRGCVLGVKLVRGAYVQKELAYARREGVPSVLYDTKEEVDQAYHRGVLLCLGSVPVVQLCVASHNPVTVAFCLGLAEANEKVRSSIWFAHLLGMADPLTWWVARYGFRVAKFVPIGEVRAVIPYLLRRLEENSGIHQQMGRELSWYMYTWMKRCGG